MSESTSWYRSAWAALSRVISSAPTLWARARSEAGRVADWLMSNPVVMAVLVVLVITTFAAVVSRQSSPPQASAAPASGWETSVQRIEARLAGLESYLLEAEASTRDLEARVAQMQAAAQGRVPVHSGASASGMAPVQPSGVTELDRRLAEFQRRIDATPSPTTTLKETAK